jgi:peptidoglycan DL-endopeptidase CwlO
VNRTKRQAPLVIALAVAALALGGSATADPSVSSKQAEAQHVLGQIQQIDSSLERAVESYNAANSKLARIRGDLKENRYALTVAKSNLSHAQRTLSSRLVALYTSDSSSSTLEVVLGASNLDDLLTRIDTAHRVSSQDSQVVSTVRAYRTAVKTHQLQLEHAQAAQQQVVAAKAAEQARIQSQLAQRRALLSTIKSQIATLQAQERQRQVALAAQARSRIGVIRPPGSGVGAAATTPEGATVAPPSRYGGVVGIAMRYLGVPYVWGGASPRGFDCSGLVMYVFAQVGVSLPHYTGGQYASGVAVSRDQLQPGDLVFFNGVSHVGIYIGGGQFIHAPHTGDVVKISSLSESWYASTYVGARRIL